VPPGIVVAGADINDHKLLADTLAVAKLTERSTSEDSRSPISPLLAVRRGREESETDA
jgi:hypothetical protein